MSRRAQGLTLIEILFSLLILAFGALGLLRLQTELLHSRIAADDYNTATNLAQAALEQRYAGRPALCANNNFAAAGAVVGGEPRFECRAAIRNGLAVVSVRWTDSDGSARELSLSAPLRLAADGKP